MIGPGATMSGEQHGKIISNESTKVDVLGTVEATIGGIFRLIGGVFRTAIDFIFRPDRLPISSEEDQQWSGYVRPLTYLTLCLLGMFTSFAAMFRLPVFAGGTSSNPQVEYLFEALKNFEEKKIFLLLLPFLLVVGLYAWCLRCAARIISRRMNFQYSVACSACFSGTVALLYTLCVPIFVITFRDGLRGNSLSTVPFSGILLGVIGWSIIIKGVHSYLHLVRQRLGTGRLLTMGIWIFGSFMFFVLHFAILAWISPLIPDPPGWTETE